MVALDPYPRGFVIFRRETPPNLPDDWPSVPLGTSGWMFAHDPAESPDLVPAGESGGWVLTHGLYLYTGDNQRAMTPAQRLAEAAQGSETEFHDLLDLLGGRHVILLGGTTGFKLFQDATGMRSVYFAPRAQLVTSHARLLNALSEHQSRPGVRGRRGFLMAWDRTPFIGINALLPNHSLEVPEFRINRFFPRDLNPYRQWSIPARVETYIKLWNRQWDEFQRTGASSILSVTGGHDSRTNLALLSDHVEDIRTFTYTADSDVESEWASSVRLDQQIVEDIRTCIPLHHEFLVVRPNVEHNMPVLTDLLAQNTVGKHGSWLLPHYLKSFPEDGVTHIRGNTYGVYKAPWGMTSTNDTLDSLQKLYLAVTKQDRGYEREADRQEHFLDGARRWQYLNDLYGYHRREIYYWEIRLGRWASEIYNETDIAFPSFDPTNVRVMLEIALSFSIPEKKTKLFQSELINATYPLLNFPGKNTTQNLYEQTRSWSPESHHFPGGLALTGGSTAPKPATNSLSLSSGITVVRDDEILESVQSPERELYMPSEHFVEGAISTRVFETPPVHGSVTFTIESDYCKALARDTWFYQISVDGVVRARWDGALRGPPAHVTISNVTPQSNIEVQILALRDRRGLKSWEKATRAIISGVHLTPHDVDAPLSVVTDVPGSSLEPTPERRTVSVDNLDQLTQADFTPEFPQRLDVVTPHCVIPLLVVKRLNAHRTVIMCNGAVDLGRSSGKPVFQRSSWWSEIPHHQIYVCDPATVGNHAIPIAWSQYSLEYCSIPDTARAIQAINSALNGAATGQSIYYGSSAGGFTALGLVALDPGACAVVNNAQFDWTTWFPTAVEATRVKRLRSVELSRLSNLPLDRRDVLQQLAMLPTPPKVQYWVNTALKHDREVSLPQWERIIEEFPHLHERMTCRRYYDESAGSAPLGKNETIALLSDPEFGSDQAPAGSHSSPSR